MGHQGAQEGDKALWAGGKCGGSVGNMGGSRQAPENVLCPHCSRADSKQEGKCLFKESGIRDIRISGIKDEGVRESIN